MNCRSWEIRTKVHGATELARGTISSWLLYSVGCSAWPCWPSKESANHNVRIHAIAREPAISSGRALVSRGGQARTAVYGAARGATHGPTMPHLTIPRTLKRSARTGVCAIGSLEVVSVWKGLQGVHASTWHATSIATTMGNVSACGDLH